MQPRVLPPRPCSIRRLGAQAVPSRVGILPHQHVPTDAETLPEIDGMYAQVIETWQSVVSLQRVVRELVKPPKRVPGEKLVTQFHLSARPRVSTPNTWQKSQRSLPGCRFPPIIGVLTYN